MLQKCADGGCSPYEYFRHLVNEDVGLNEADPVPEPEEPEEEEKEIERDNIEKRYKIVG